MTKSFVAAAAFAAFTLAATTASATSFLTNGGFEAPSGGATSSSFGGDGGTSAAPTWELYNNAGGQTFSDVQASNAPGGQVQMLHLATPGNNDGIYQRFFSLAQYAQVSVRVVSGQVALYLYSDSGTHQEGVAYSTAGSGWQTLNVDTGSANSNEIVIYGVGGGAEFYVDNAYASDVAAPTAVPEPATWALMIAGFGGAGAMLRRRRAAIA